VPSTGLFLVDWLDQHIGLVFVHSDVRLLKFRFPKDFFYASFSLILDAMESDLKSNAQIDSDFNYENNTGSLIFLNVDTEAKKKHSLEHTKNCMTVA
jgi:hypothetical protein